MGQDADEFLPRLHFPFFEFALDILNRCQDKRFAVHPKFRGIDEELEQFVLVLHFDQGLVARVEFEKRFGQGLADRFQLAHVAQVGFAEQALRRVVDQFDAAFGRVANQPDAHVLHDGLEVLKIFLFFRPGFAKRIQDLVESIFQIRIGRTQPGTGKKQGKILVPNRLQKAREIAIRTLDIVYERPGLIEHARADHDRRGLVRGGKEQVKAKTGGGAQQGHAQRTDQAKVFIGHVFPICDRARCA